MGPEAFGELRNGACRSPHIGEKTASVHVSNILAKLGAANRAEAGAKARALGLDRL
jgi:DNA-binding NarL/FixJ family response regulator